MHKSPNSNGHQSVESTKMLRGEGSRRWSRRMWNSSPPTNTSKTHLHDMILYIENPKDVTRKLPELINEFVKVTGYKINAQKSLAFLYTNDEKSESEIKKTIPFTTATKRIKQLGINLPKETKDLYTENYKTLMKEIKNDTNRGFPGGAVVESPPADAGGTGSSPGLGGSHVPRSGWARGPQLLGLRDWSLCSAAGEAAIVRGPRTAVRSGPHLPQLERALAQKRRPNTAINK